MNTSNRYHYDFLPQATVLVVLFYVGLSAWMVYLARSYVEYGFSFTALSAIFAALALVAFIRRIAFPSTLELTDDAILIPRGHLWLRTTTILYDDIISIREFGSSLEIATQSDTVTVGALRFESYPEVRELISVRTAIALPQSQGCAAQSEIKSDELPSPLLQWMEPENWYRFRTRAEIAKPVLFQFRTELWFFVRCVAFCCVFIVVPIYCFVLHPWLFALESVQVVHAFISSFFGVVALAAFLTMLHWLDGINPVRPETQVSLRERGIMIQLPNGQRFHWNYRRLSGWTIIERRFQDQVTQILLLERSDSHTDAIALPDTGIREQVVKILKDRHVAQTPGLRPSWEES